MSDSLHDRIINGILRTQNGDRNDKLKGNRCPNCSTKLDAATAGDGSDVQPRPGDVTVCINCGEILEFDGDLSLVSAGKEALAQIAGCDQFKAILDIQAAYRRGKDAAS